ncbi:MAG TPA: hypothetical protein VNK43_12130 [Gemmatimonadales bacterium]|nr:hypothetical protein [Gemmatimonadales bacterium]
MHPSSRAKGARPLLVALAAGSLVARPFADPLGAQETAPALEVTAQAVVAYTHLDPIPGRGSLGEVRVVHPLVTLEAATPGGRFAVRGSFNLDGWTVPDGELAIGVWGEGFVDRRHPHTYVHELLLVGRDLLGSRDGRLDLSLALGKGFVPFGTDDPMSRPPLRYPVNHHLSQILERALALGAARYGPVVAEAAVFNGDEPDRPGRWPNLHRFGDSWAARLTVHPVDRLELQLSHADVFSPEHRPGGGIEQTKWSASARWSGPLRGVPVYGLVEWARTSEAGGFFEFETVLVEGAIRIGPHRPYYRLERTERPEEHRAFDLFRSPRPHIENVILGVTRWTIHTLGYRHDVRPRLGALELAPFVEASFARAAKVDDGVFDPETFYGRDRFWSASLGVRIGWGMDGHRMGRYGAAAQPAHGAHRH